MLAWSTLAGPVLAHPLVTSVLAKTPPPSRVDDDLVTPGVAGFVITAIVAIAAVLLIVDMTRRIRRVRYREEARDRIAAEIAEAEGAAGPRG